MVIAAVDPNKKDLKLLVKCLRKAYPAAEIVMFSDPFSAEKYFRDTPIDVLFTETAMLGTSGFRLKNITEEVQPALLTVFMSATEEYALESIKAHAQYYIVKPVTPDAVCKALKETKYS